MSAIEIVLLIIGFLSISVSFFVGNKRNAFGETEETEFASRQLWSDKEEALVKERIQSILDGESDEIIANTIEVLNRKSNEKIMEFDEFSAQVLEKIKHNHEEVVFMYSMLSEKEKEIKENVAKSATTKKMVEKQPAHAKATGKKSVSTEKQKVATRRQSSALEEKVPKTESVETSGVANAQIIGMYKSGKSVLEISKELNIGQGEVKLMIALYGGKV